MTPITVIHHSADYDGLFCREIAKKFLPDAELIGWDFSDKTLNFPEGLIYVLDLPIDKPFGLENSIKGIGFAPNLLARLVWIDHHKSSIESHPTNIPGYRIDGVAACRLAWQWFTTIANSTPSGILFPKEDFIDRKVSEPLAVRLAGEYDIWDKRDSRADVFQFGLRSKELTPQDWKELLSEKIVPCSENTGMDISETDLLVCSLLQNGSMLQTYQQRNDAGMMHRSFIVEWEGLKFLALTTARCNSLTFAAKDAPETGHDALLGFYFNGKVWTVSLYHANHRKDLDLSTIAVKYGGGGHRGACGFSCEKLPFL